MANGRAKRRKLDLLIWLYDGRCFWCGVHISRSAHAGDPMALTIDELLPVSRDGKRLLPNQVPAHRVCNARRGNFIAPRAAFARHHAVLKSAGIEVEEL